MNRRRPSLRLAAFLSLAAALSGCSKPAPSPPVALAPGPPTSADELRRILPDAIAGTANSITIAGLQLTELPARFDLNPKRTTLMSMPPGKRIWAGKHDEVIVSSRKIGPDDTIIWLEPIIDASGAGSVKLIWSARDSIHWQYPGGIVQTLEAPSDSSTVLVIDDDGHPSAAAGPNWNLIVALQGNTGVICWRDPAHDGTFARATAPSAGWVPGFRRFELVAPSAGVPGTGFMRLRPLLPTDH